MLLASVKSYMEIRQARLRDIASVIRGVSFDKTETSQSCGPNLIPILRAGNISDSLDTDHGLVWVPRNRVSKEQLLTEQDIAICMSSGSREVVGKSALLDKPWVGSVGAFCAVIRTDSSVCVPEYLAFFLKSSAFRTWTKASEGINIKNVRKSELENFSVPIPPIQEQRRIVDILKRSDGICRLRKQAIQTARELIPALFVEMFGDPATNPKGLPVFPLGNLLVDVSYGCSTKATTDPDSGLPILRMGNVTTDGRLDLDDLKYVALPDNDKRKYGLAKGDILFNRTNSKDLVGKTGLWDGRFEAIAASYFIRVRTDQSRLLPTYLWVFMNTSFMKRCLFETARGAIGQANINAKELKSFKIPLPSLNVQQDYEDRLSQLRSIEVQQTSAEAIGAASFQSLLHRAFCGDL